VRILVSIEEKLVDRLGISVWISSHLPSVLRKSCSVMIEFELKLEEKQLSIQDHVSVDSHLEIHRAFEDSPKDSPIGL